MTMNSLILAFLLLTARSSLLACAVTLTGRILSDSGEALYAAEVSAGDARAEKELTAVRRPGTDRVDLTAAGAGEAAGTQHHWTGEPCRPCASISLTTGE
jgi:hypothetical protein